MKFPLDNQKGRVNKLRRVIMTQISFQKRFQIFIVRM